MNPIPYEIIEALIQCFGRCFHWKNNMESFLISAGVDRALAARDKNEHKFVWARKLLSDLNQTENGRLVARRIVTEFYKLRDLPDADVPDRNSGIDKLKQLKALALENKFIVEEQKKESNARSKLAEDTAKIASLRAEKLNSLLSEFTSKCLMGTDRQAAGYCLEKILKELFLLSEIEYTGSFKTETEQVDGYFSFGGFGYLVEAKCTRETPTKKDILGFISEAKERLQSTRGLFVSVNGFRPEVANELNGTGSNVVLFDGGDLTCVLDGRIDLKDALQAKINHASTSGEVYFSLLTCHIVA